MLGGSWTRGRAGALALVAVLSATIPAAAPLAQHGRSYGGRGYHHDRGGHGGSGGALMGGIIGGAILGTLLFGLSQSSEPPRYMYVEPPPAYYPPAPAPQYPPVPAYPAPGTYPPQTYVPVPVPAPEPPPANLTQRLEDLQQACKRGLLTKSECEYRRKAILEGM